jgi:hypothetical protein
MIKRHFILTLLIIFCGCSKVSSQIGGTLSPNSKFKCLELTLTGQTYEGPKNNLIHSVEFRDERPDTSKAGYYFLNKKNSIIKKICFPSGLGSQSKHFVNSYLKNIIDSSTGSKILGCIRKLWVACYDTMSRDQDYMQRTRKLTFTIDYYKNDNNCYIPLYRFDSIFLFDEIPEQNVAALIENMLEASLQKILNNTISNSPSNYLCLSTKQVDSFYQSTHNIKALENIAPKGAYMTFRQFINRTPSHKEFKSDFNKQTHLIYIKGRSIEDSLIKPFLISDGTSMYISIEGNFFKLYKINNTFDLYSYDFFYKRSSYITPPPIKNAPSRIVVQPGAYIPKTIANYSKIGTSRPYQLDLHTGEIY